MELTKWDIKIMLAMTLFVVIISFVFPPLGFGDTDVNHNNIPEFDITENTFEFTNIDPNDPDNVPTSPDSGRMQYVHDQSAQQDDRSIWIHRGMDGDTIDLGYNVVLLPEERPIPDRDKPQNSSTITPEISLYQYNSTGVTEVDNATITEGEYIELTSDRYDIAFENVRYSNQNSTSFSITVDYEVLRSPGGSGGDSGWLERIPVVGSAAQDIASGISSAVTYIGSLLYNLTYNFMVLSTNLMLIIYNTVTFFIAFVSWLIGSYASVISNSPNPFVTVFIVIPGVLLSFEFSKLVIIIVRSMPLI